MTADRSDCPICGTPSHPERKVEGRSSRRAFELRRCPQCRFVFVADPITDLASVYDDAYYRGEGADPLVDYEGELRDPVGTVRQYEWRGVLARVSSLVPIDGDTKWLDFGCGAGGLVQFLRDQGLTSTIGYEPEWGERRLQHERATVVGDDVLGREGEFDVLTAIEVIEHALDPIGELTRMRSLLREGGLLFLTTGNAEPHAAHLDRWGYVVPEVHVSYFEPSCLALALTKAGFEPAFPGFGPGWSDIIRFKVLKNLRRRRRGLAEMAVPWPLVSRFVDHRLAVAAQPVGWAR